MSFFNKFPLTNYDLYNTGTGGLDIPNIFLQIKTISPQYDSITPYRFYEITDERPDQLSQKLYNSPDYHWTFFLINEHLKGGYKNWPMSDNHLIDFVENQYPGWAVTGFRTANDDIEYNSFAGKFEVGTILTGETSGAKAVVTGRDIQVNQLHFDYTDTTKFTGSERILGSDGNIIQANYILKLHKDAVRYYVDSEGNKHSNYENLFLPNELVVTNTLHEQIMNNNRRYLRILRPDFVRDFTIVYRKVLNA